MDGALDNAGLYSAFISKDTRFDGRFFVGISSTGIYCRPVCGARTPKEKNCSFYKTAAEAEQAGYRPCLICRPELAPGRSITDATSSLARRAARLLEEDCKSGQSLETLAGRLGCTDRHLRRVFASEYHISPVQYLQTCRLLLAKSLLTDTDILVAEVAIAAGFGSLRRFNDLFKRRYHLSPTALRKQSKQQGTKQEAVTLQLGYRPPYRWDEMLGFLGQRAIPGIESIFEGQYCRTVRHSSSESKELCGWIRVGHNPKKGTLTVTLSEALLPVASQVLARVRHLFDLHCEPALVYKALSSMNDIRPNLCVLGTRVPGCYNAFEMAMRAILGQQITVKAATTLAGRVASTFGTPIETGIEGLSYLFPHPSELLSQDIPLEDALGSLGVISTRARTIKALARSLISKEINLDLCVDPKEEIEKLMSIKGVGSWTAHYIAMRTMEWSDSFLETDAGIKHALAPATPKEMLTMAQSWRPWRSYATVNLWNSLTQN